MSETPQVHELNEPPAQRSHPVFWLVLAVLSSAYLALWLWSRTSFPYAELVHRIAAPGLAVLPFVPLILFATLSRQLPAFRNVTVIYWLLLGMGAVIFSGVFAASAVAKVDQPGGNPRDAFPLGSLTKIATIVLLSAASVVVGLLCFTPSMRRVAARWMPLDPDSFPDAVALATTVTLVLALFAPLAVLHEPVFLGALRHAPKALEENSTTRPQLIDTYAQLAWTLPVTFLAAGYPLVRDFRSALRRLGLVMPTPGQLLYALVAAMALVAFMITLEKGIDRLWTWLDWPKTDLKAFDELLSFAKSSAGAIAIGITAGIGEELTFRGLLQPRLGIVGANLLFTAVHAPQYHTDALLSVFVIGLILGFIRKRFNTSTAIIVHGLYDFFVVLAVLFNAPGFQ